MIAWEGGWRTKKGRFGRESSLARMWGHVQSWEGRLRPERERPSVLGCGVYTELGRVGKSLNYKSRMKDRKAKGEVVWVTLPIPWRDRFNLSAPQLHLHEAPHCHLTFLAPGAECELGNPR